MALVNARQMRETLMVFSQAAPLVLMMNVQPMSGRMSVVGNLDSEANVRMMLDALAQVDKLLHERLLAFAVEAGKKSVAEKEKAGPPPTG